MLVCVCFVLFSARVNANELPPLDLQEAYKPILIEAGDLPANGMAIERLSLAAIIDDVVEPIPFQIDEYNEGGAVYFKDWDVPLSGSPEVFDGLDKLLFIYKDAGPRRRDYHVFDGDIVAEIELEGISGIKRYVYLLQVSKLRSDEYYVRYSSDLARVETDFYTLTYQPENHLNWRDFAFKNYLDKNPLDSMKLRLNAGLMTSLSPIELSNDDMVATPSGERVGPIRTVTQLSVTVWITNLPVLKLSSQLHHYPKSMHYDVRVVIPSLRRKLLVDPSLTMTIDANNLMAASVRTALGPRESGIVDGEINQTELQMLDAGVTGNKNWIWVSTKRNLDILAYFNYVGDTDEPLSLFYHDDATSIDPPERYPGQLPNLGYTVESFPDSGFFGYVISILFSDGFEGNPMHFAEAARRSPAIRIYHEAR